MSVELPWRASENALVFLKYAGGLIFVHKALENAELRRWTHGAILVRTHACIVEFHRYS